jgi:hypothetical protein
MKIFTRLYGERASEMLERQKVIAQNAIPVGVNFFGTASLLYHPLRHTNSANPNLANPMSIFRPSPKMSPYAYGAKV